MRIGNRVIVSLLIAGLFGGLATAQDRVIIRGGTLINVRDGRLSPNTTIVLEGDRIVSVGSGSAPASGGTVIDAAGKFILPGFIDSHAHYKDWAVELYLNHGVTTVVDLGNDHEWIKSQKDGVRSGFIPGPRLFISTNNFDGPPENLANYFVRPYVHLVKDPEDAMRAMQQYLQEKVDAVKLYEGLSVETVRAIVREAAKANIPVIGHFRDVRIAADAKANGVEHLSGVANAILDQQARNEALKKVRKGFTPPPESFMDIKKIPEIAQLMVKNNLFMNPTLRMSWQGDRSQREKGFHVQDFELLLNDWRLRYIPLQWKLANLKEYQEIEMWNWKDLTPYEQDIFHQGYTNSLRLVKAFSDAGGKLYSGTDCANMCTPGLGLHQELDLMVDSGIAPLKALQAATINAAELMRLQDRLGTIEEGKAADVLILDANPLENIKNTLRIAQVISRGRVLDGQYHADFHNPIPKNDWEDSSHFFPAPRIQWASPEAMVAGVNGVTLTVHGTGFIPYSLVRLGDQPLKTEFVDPSQLRAEVPETLLQPGTHEVTVANPDFAWGTIFAPGASDISHLGIRSYLSNPFLVLVKPQGGSPVFPHPREQGTR